jgi:two-component system chemotaxis response regulator CheB
MRALTGLRDFGHDVIVIGASAGGLEALRQIVASLPPSIPAAVFVVIHTGAQSERMLAPILARTGHLPASYANDGDPILTGQIYVAPPDHHLLIEPGFMRTTKGPRENGFRPAVDPLFRTAAAAYGARVAGIVLSGGQNDGTLGLLEIKRAGGLTIAQDPDEALVGSMPESAIQYVGVDHIVAAEAVASILLNHHMDAGTRSMSKRMKKKRAVKGVGHRRLDIAEVGTDLLGTGHRPKQAPSVFTCPECGGSLWETSEHGVLRYRCHVGHAYTGEALVDSQTEVLEQAMWTALRSLEEAAFLRKRMSQHARERGLHVIADRYDEQWDDYRSRAAIVRKALVIDDVSTAADKPAARVAERARRASEK